MLDDLKYIHQKDTEDALGLAEKQWQQLLHAFPISFAGEMGIENVVHSGMGGTAAWAMLATTYPGFSLPFEITRGYDIPGYVSNKTLFIAASYSGNTEETISSLQQAEAQGAQIVVISSGGKLKDMARDKGYPFVELPKIARPRFGTLYGLKALVSLAGSSGWARDRQAVVNLETAADFLKSSMTEWLPDVPTSKNLAKQIAQELMGRSIVIYSGSLLYPAAYKWKIALNENSHNLAWAGCLPDFSHNEFTSWTSHPLEKPYAIIFLTSSLDHERVQKRFDLSERLLSGRWPSPERIEVAGATQLEQVLWTSVLGDFVSIYLALLNGRNPIDPLGSDIVEKFKNEMGDYHG